MYLYIQMYEDTIFLAQPWIYYLILFGATKWCKNSYKSQYFYEKHSYLFREKFSTRLHSIVLTNIHYGS